MAVWVPLSRALRRYGPVVGPVVVDKLRREAQPYLSAYQQARRVDGYLGAWQDEAGRHWVVLDAQRQDIVGSFPPMSSRQRELALEHLDPAQLHHHADTVLARLAQAPSRLRRSLPSRSRGDDGA